LEWTYPLGLSIYYQDPKLAKEYFYMDPFTLINLQPGISEDLYTDPNLGGYCMAFHATSQQDPYQTFKQGLSYPGFADALACMPIHDRILITQYLVQCVDASKYSLSNVLDLTLSGASNNKEECINSIAYTFIQQGILNVASNMITAEETINKVILFTGLNKEMVQSFIKEVRMGCISRSNYFGEAS